MSRLASRSPAALFQTSRPAPVSHDSDQARTRELKRLKARVNELEEEIAQLRSCTDTARRSLHKALESSNPAHAFTMIEKAISAVSIGGGEKS